MEEKAVKNGRRKQDRAAFSYVGEKDGRHGGEIRVSRIGWSAGQDRIVTWEKNGVCGVEGSGGEATAFEEKRKRQLEALGFPVYVIDGMEQIGGVLDEICAT